MRRIFTLLLTFVLVGVLGGCRAKELVSPTEAPVEAPIAASTETPLTDGSVVADKWARDTIPFTNVVELSVVDSVLVEMLDPYGDLQRYPLQFTDHGLIKGTVDLMVPLTEQPSSAFTALGMDVFIEVNGQSSRITRNGVTLDFHVDDIQSYRNDKPFGLLPDICFYDNGTLYAPFEVILRAFELPFSYDKNRLIIILHDKEEEDETTVGGY